MMALFMIFAITPMIQAQTISVSGVVTTQQGEPLIGATVMEKGTSNGTATNIDGEYTINVKKGATLQFSYVGCKPADHKVTGPNLDVILLDEATMLDELVVVGYGVQKKSSLTGAVSQLKTEDMENRTITDATQALQGKTSGVQVFSSSARPGASPQIRIRGISSNGSCDPLYVVDGRVADSGIGGIDPNDIESMEVLKDGASAAIYGARAGNGVILITTKKGKGNGKITYDFQFASQSMNKVPKVMNSEQYIDYYTTAGLFDMNKVYNNWDFKTNTDWIKTAFESSKMHRHNLAFSAGSDRGNIYISLSYLSNNGMVSGDSDTYQRITGMVNASYKIKPWLEVGTNNQVEYYKVKSVAEGSEYGSYFLSALTQDPLTPPTYTLENMPAKMLDIYYNNPLGYLLSDGKGNYYSVSEFLASESPNPLIMRDRAFNESRGFNINGTTYINFIPWKPLTITSRLSYRLSGGESYGVSYPYYGNATQKQNWINVSAGANTPTYYQWENFANYNQTFGLHNVGAMIGMSFSENRSFSVSGSMYGNDDDIGFLQNNPLYYYWAYATAAATKTLSGGEPIYTRRLAYFGRLSYDYDGKYLAQFSLRADAADTSVLPTKKRWGYFPAASVGWVISRENFMEQSRGWLSNLKLRLSWGRNGSTASLGGYSYASVIASSGHYPIDIVTPVYVQGYAPSSTGNPDLQWETSEQFDVGIDARFLNNRLSFTADWYNKTTKDLIVTGITPSTVVGNTASPVNAGNIRNRGFEFELGWQDQVGDFTYGIRGNITTLSNEVTRIHESLSAIEGTTYHNETITRFEVGKPAWYFYGYKYTGIDPETGDPMFADLNGDGQITADDKTNIGCGLPKFTYGITLNAAWKGLDLLVFGSGSGGNDVFCCLNRQDFAMNKLTYFTENRWTPTNTQNATQPRAGAANMSQWMRSSAVVLNGSYFKLKQIQLGYTLPNNITRKFFVEHLRVYLSLDDFVTFTKYPGFDPETTGVGSSLGVDKGTYPNSKKFVVGLNVTF